MKKWLNTNKYILFFSLVLSILFLSPYLINSFIPLGHDTTFHLSRIEGLAQSIKDGTLIPAIYPYKNNNFGYASPLFYSDLLLILPALLYLLFNNIYWSYFFALFLATFFSSFAISKLTQTFTKATWLPFISSVLYLFCNYRITNVFVRGALGEVFATCFLPIAVLGIYNVLFSEKKSWLALVIGFSGLILSHNLSFLLACVLFFIFILINSNKLFQEKRWIPILKATITTFLLTAFFSLPMLEQLTSQKFYLNYYATSMDLKSYALPLSTYFINQATFSYQNTMASNVGPFIAIAPLFFLWFNRKKVNSFLFQCTILGYIFMILPLDIFPWEFFSFFRVLQFPWRLMIVSSTLLCLPATLSLADLPRPKLVLPITGTILLICALFRVSPVLSWSYGITPQTKYSELLDGTFSDPASTFYLRAELAGADYLPLNSLDYREASLCIQELDQSTNALSVVTCDLIKDGTVLSYSLNQAGIYILPLTYYKGYQTYFVSSDGDKVAVPTEKSMLTLVQITTKNGGTFVTEYAGTTTQHLSLFISSITLATLLIMIIKTKGALFK
ncbi:MAG: hypothetical protein ACK5LZ_02225 [Anaerorhabdus sp.]